MQTSNQNNNGLIGDGSYNIINSGNHNQVNHVVNQFNITEAAIPEGEGVELDRLLDRYVSKDALFNYIHSPPECYTNTRTTVRNEINWWIDESESEKSPLLWLNGPAAVGKSVIAKTISGSQAQVVATFFFSTSSNKSATTLFPTLAWQLGRRISDTRKHIIASLNKHGSLQTSQIEEQFDLLILQPLKTITTLKYRPIMVIDGVDECVDNKMLIRFLQVLVRAGEHGCSMPVRFMICSRPEARIHGILGRVRDVNLSTNKTEQQLPVPTLSSHHLKFLYLSFLFGGYQLCLVLNSNGEKPRYKNFLKDVWKFYRPIRLGVDKDAPSPSDKSQEHADLLDKIYPHPVISTIQIGNVKPILRDTLQTHSTQFLNQDMAQALGFSNAILQIWLKHLVDNSFMHRLLSDFWTTPALNPGIFSKWRVVDRYQPQI